MKIHLDNVILAGSRSGPHTFAQRLAHQLVAAGHELQLTDGRHADVSLVFIQPSGAPFARRVIQRIDGIWAKSSDVQANIPIRQMYAVADGVIFQSAFDAKYVTTRWGAPERQTVIHNGIPIVRPVVSPEIQAVRGRYENVFVCSSSWRRNKRLFENVQLFQQLEATYPNSVLIVMGENPDFELQRSNIIYTGSVSHDVCLQVFSIADWMLHLEYFGHCPNVVVEALSQGCPVVCTDGGGQSELVGGYGVVLPEVSPFDFTAPCEYHRPPALHYSRLARLPERSDLGQHIDIDIVSVAQRYVDFMSSVL